MIDEYKLHSPKLHTAIAPRLNELINIAKSLRMAVAYWTISEDDFLNKSGKLVELLKNKNSFACIDITLPTDVSKICEFAKNNASMYFYLQQCIDETKDKPPYMPNHLLHSKIFIFDLPENKASILIGSHNWTKRALSGINIETTIEIEVNQNSEIYQQANSLLNKIKNSCHKINPNFKKLYKSLQREGDSSLYLHSNLDEDELGKLPKKKPLFFHLFINNLELKNLPNGRSIFLFLSKRLEKKKGYLLEGKVIKGGQLPSQAHGSNWPNLEVTNGYWCLKDEINDTYDEFNLMESLEEKQKNKFDCYATIQISNTEEITNIDTEFFNKYQPAINIPQDSENFIKFLQKDREEDNDLNKNDNDWNKNEWFKDLFVAYTKRIKIKIQSPKIDSEAKISDYISKIEFGKMSKVTVKQKSD